MDIFTTQLTRVAPNQAKPTKQRVKAAAKDAQTRSLDEEADHLREDVEDNVLLIEQEQKRQQKAKQHSGAAANEEVELETKKPDDDKDGNHHLDIYV